MAKSRTNSGGGRRKFRAEFLNDYQRMAYAAYQQHDCLFLLGPAGVGKTYLAMAFAMEEVLNKVRRKIVLTRPIVESGESLGFLPGDFYEKVNPYMMPLYDSIAKIAGETGNWRETIDKSLDICPIAYMRGRTFDDAICLFDEAQNASLMQIKLFLSRLGENSKMIITGDPEQSDCFSNGVPLEDVVNKLENVQGVSVIKFNKKSIVRHELVGRILENL